MTPYLPNSRETQPKLGKLVNQGRNDAHTVYLDQLSKTARLPLTGRPVRGGRNQRSTPGAYKGQKQPHSCERGQWARSGLYQHLDSWELLGASWRLMNA